MTGADTIIDETDSDYTNPGADPVVFDIDTKRGRYLRLEATKLNHPKGSGGPMLALSEMRIYSGSKEISRNARVTSLDTINSGLWHRRNLVDGYTSRRLIVDDVTEGLLSLAKLKPDESENKLNELRVRLKDLQKSSINKGESFYNTLKTIDSIGMDLFIIRHFSSGAAYFLAKNTNSSVINAGDGRREHPTQALLDALTIINRKKKIEGLKIAICGDILHSRVARSNIYLLTMLGAEVNIIAPTNLMPKEIEKFGVNTFTDMNKGLKDCDIVMMLRLQNERMTGSFLSSNREYYEYYGLTPDKLEVAKKDALIMHPGPMNRGVEIDSSVADSDQAIILNQVLNGVASRMAILYLLLGGKSEGGKD